MIQSIESVCLCLFVGPVLGGCAASPSPGGPSSPAHTAEPPAAVVNGRAVSRSELLPRLSEAAGARVLEEFVLDRSIKRELTARELTLSEQEIEAERAGLLWALSGETGLDETESVRLEQRIREARGLGPVRWRAMLERSAGLRKLIADRVDLSETALRLAYELRTGPRASVRLYQSATRAEASRVRSEVLASQTPEDTLARLAADGSTDAGARGGLVAVSPLDPRVPESVRRTIADLTPGEISGVLATDLGFSLVMLVERSVTEPVPFDSIRDELVRSVRLRQERLLMESEARRLLQDSGITVFDASLDWAWKNRSG